MRRQKSTAHLATCLTLLGGSTITPSMLWGRGWRARVRRWFNRPYPIHLVIEPGTPRAEQVRVVGLRGNEIIVERG